MEVRAELTATVWKVVVEQGATVAEGDELVILESMKMEIPVAAPVAELSRNSALRKKTALTRVI
jgi:biotin carboxyl carrier protein